MDASTEQDLARTAVSDPPARTAVSEPLARDGSWVILPPRPAVPLMGPADRGTAVPLMGPADPATAVPLMSARR